TRSAIDYVDHPVSFCCRHDLQIKIESSPPVHVPSSHKQIAHPLRTDRFQKDIISRAFAGAASLYYKTSLPSCGVIQISAHDLEHRIGKRDPRSYSLCSSD